MNIILWSAQVVLAVLFLFAGTTKVFTPLPELAQNLPWVAGVPAWMPRLAGISETLGAIGLILPALTRVLPQLVPISAAGLATVMAMAAVLHFNRGEMPAILVNIVLLAIAAFVAYGRYSKAPILPR